MLMSSATRLPEGDGILQLEVSSSVQGAVEDKPSQMARKAWVIEDTHKIGIFSQPQ